MGSLTRSDTRVLPLHVMGKNICSIAYSALVRVSARVNRDKEGMNGTTHPVRLYGSGTPEYKRFTSWSLLKATRQADSAQLATSAAVSRFGSTRRCAEVGQNRAESRGKMAQSCHMREKSRANTGSPTAHQASALNVSSEDVALRNPLKG